LWHYIFQKQSKYRILDSARADIARATVEDGSDFNPMASAVAEEPIMEVPLTALKVFVPS